MQCPCAEKQWRAAHRLPTRTVLVCRGLGKVGYLEATDRAVERLQQFNILFKIFQEVSVLI